MMRAMVRDAMQRSYLRYALVSVVALASDLVSFAVLLGEGLSGAGAAATAYSIGILVHWLLSSRIVFDAALAPQGAQRLRQQGLFLLSAFVGLGITTATVGLSHAAGMDAMAAKACAVLLSFHAVYLIRRMLVFAR